MRSLKSFFLVCSLTLLPTVIIAQDPVTDIGTEREVNIEDYCVARGSGGRDGHGDGRYTAPNGYSILSAETTATRCKRCSIRTTNYTQPGFVSLRQESGIDYSKSLVDFANSMEDKVKSLRLLAVTGIANNIRVVQGTSHAIVEHRCHAESHRVTFGGHDNGWGYYDLKVILMKEPTGSDYAALLLELISATEAGDTAKFNAIIEAIKAAN